MSKFLLCCSGKNPPQKRTKNLIQQTREEIEFKTARRLRFTNDQLYEFT
jgi:hypothetical protein